MTGSGWFGNDGKKINVNSLVRNKIYHSKSLDNLKIMPIKKKVVVTRIKANFIEQSP